MAPMPLRQHARHGTVLLLAAPLRPLLQTARLRQMGAQMGARYLLRLLRSWLWSPVLLHRQSPLRRPRALRLKCLPLRCCLWL